MSRPRRFEPDDILDAAERVILRVGAAGLSIDAVAKELGISKSQVLYDHKSKSALLEAVVERQLNKDESLLVKCISESAASPHPELFGRIASAERRLDDSDKAVALAITASLASDDSIVNKMREWTKNDLEAMVHGPKPEAALMSYLALTGFCCTELFSFYHWSDQERTKILEGMRKMYLCYEQPISE